ncbi:MAG: MFS transporter [Ilumatobacter sp.]|uniref:MFS transporter n=1 Tax=Ilumatobacter sp. TaxID=1967498 RepID=UPI003C7156AA
MTSAVPGSPRTSLRNVLAHPAFRRLFIAQTVSRWGDTFNAVALVIVVFQISNSGITVSGVVALEVVPVVLLGFFAGTVVDRLPRVRVMIAADLGRAAIAALVAFQPDELWALYSAAFGLAALTVFFNPAASSLLPSLVDDDELVAANSAIWSAAVMSQIVLAPLAGAVVVTLGASVAFGLNSATFLVSAVSLSGLRVSDSSPRLERGSRRADIVDGIRIIRRNRLLGTIATVQGLAALSAGATSALLVVLAQRHLDIDARGFGLLLAAIGVGAATGPLVLQRYVTDVRTPALLFGPYLLRGIVDIVLAAASNFAVALTSLGLYGVGTSTGNVTYNTVLQTALPERFRGRVFAFYDVVWQTGRLVSIGAGGILADRFGIRAVYVLGGLLLIGAGVVGLGLAPRRLLEARITEPGAATLP